MQQSLKPVLKNVWHSITQHRQLILKLLGYSTIILALGFYVWQIYTKGFEFDWRAYRLNWYFLGGVLLIHAVGLVYGSLGWALIMQGVAQRSDLFKSAKIYYLTAITRNLPGLALNILSRVALHEEEGRGKTVTVVAMLVERLLITLASALTYILTLLLFGGEAIIPIYYVVILVMVGLVIISPPIFKKLVRRVPGYDQNKSVAQDFSLGRILFLLILYSFAIILGTLMLYMAINVIYPLSAEHLPTLNSVWSFTIMIMLLTIWIPGSLRIRDATLLVTLSHLTSPSIALVITLLWRYIVMSADLFWGGLTLLVMWFRGDGLWLEAKGLFLAPLKSIKVPILSRRK